MMKDALKVSALLVVIAFAMVLVTPFAETNTNAYALTAKVVEVDRDADLVTVVDGAGNAWQFEGVEDWEEDDFVSLLMDDNGTEFIYDDVILAARYAGTF